MKIASILRSAALAALLFVPGLALGQGTNTETQVNAQTGATYTFVPQDCGKLVTFNDGATAVAVTLPQAGATIFGGCPIKVANLGQGNVTITPTTSTIDGVATAIVPPGAAFGIYNNSTHAAVGNYVTDRNTGSAFAPVARRNLLENSQMLISQRLGTTASGNVVATPLYEIDRWADVSVASGNLTVQKVTTGLPTGFVSGVTLSRTGSGVGLNCHVEAIKSSDITPYAAAGVPLVLSFYAQAGSGFSAASSAMTVKVITGTGNDESLISAITAQAGYTTGAATPVNASQVITATAARYTNIQVPLASTATEAAVELCWTSVGASPSSDTLTLTGIQLESGTVSSPYEFRPYDSEYQTALAYAYVLNEDGTAGSVQVGGGSAQGTSTTCTAYVPFPVPLRIAPTYANALSATTFKLVSASQTATALSTPFSATLGANSVYGASINFTTTGMTAKDGCFLVSTATSTGQMVFSGDL